MGGCSGCGAAFGGGEIAVLFLFAPVRGGFRGGGLRDGGSLRSRGRCFLARCVALRVVCVAGCSGLFFEYRDVVLHVFSADRLGGGCWLRSAGGFTRRVGGDRHFRKSDIKLGSGVSIS